MSKVHTLLGVCWMLEGGPFAVACTAYASEPGGAVASHIICNIVTCNNACRILSKRSGTLVRNSGQTSGDVTRRGLLTIDPHKYVHLLYTLSLSSLLRRCQTSGTGSSRCSSIYSSSSSSSSMREGQHMGSIASVVRHQASLPCTPCSSSSSSSSSSSAACISS